jgi:hypothetical protein
MLQTGKKCSIFFLKLESFHKGILSYSKYSLGIKKNKTMSQNNPSNIKLMRKEN